MKIYWNGESKNIIEERLKRANKQNIFQRILAARLTLSGAEFSDLTILRIKHGKRFVPDYEIAVIVDYFKVSADYLLGRTRITGGFPPVISIISSYCILKRYPTPLIFSI